MYDEKEDRGRYVKLEESGKVARPTVAGNNTNEVGTSLLPAAGKKTSYIHYGGRYMVYREIGICKKRLFP